MKSTPTNTPKYHLADVDPDLRTRVLDLCFRRLFDDALDVLLKHGFIHYTRDDLINFYHWAPATLPSQTHIDPEPTPKTPRDYSPPPANQIADIRSRLAELPPDLLERVNHALKHDPIQHAATLLWKAGVGLCSAELYEYRKTLFPPNSLIDAYTQDPPILRPASPDRGCGEAQPQQSPTAAAVAAPESIFPIIPTPASGADVAPAGSEVPAPSTHVLADPLPPVPSIDLSSHPPIPAMLARKRRGKIAALPKEVRDELNARLEANQSYRTIARWLATIGHPGFNHQNLHDWRKGGHQDWRRENERLQAQIMQREWLSEQVAQTKPGELFLLIDQRFVTQLLDALFGLDTGVMKEGLAANPRHYISLFSAYNRFKRHAMNSEEFRAFLQHQKALEEFKNRDKAGLSDEGRRWIEEAYNLCGPDTPSNIVKDSQG